MLAPLLWALPWLGVLVFLLVVARLPRELPPPPRPGPSSPFVSVIVPARNEAANIEACVRSLVASTYPAYEVVVVDDRSDDTTADIMRCLPAGRARRLVLVEGADLPEGWLGKPWACRQGWENAEGDVLLFTDADTTHGPDLLSRAIRGLEEEGADLLTVVGAQLMETFWERVIQPQIFIVMFFRFPRLERTVKSSRWWDALANGQYMMFRRSAYEAVGTHEGVRDRVVEDLALAQRVKRAGLRLRIRGAETDLATRMYRSLGQLVEGWSKNLVTGGLETLPAWLRPLAPPLSLALGVTLWLVPPLALLAGLLGLVGPGIVLWAATATLVSAGTWAWFSARMGAPAAYGLLYPLGAAVGTGIFLRAWVRRREVVWKGRRYTLPPLSVGS